jgi:hypothetical protein
MRFWLGIEGEWFGNLASGQLLVTWIGVGSSELRVARCATVN